MPFVSTETGVSSTLTLHSGRFYQIVVLEPTGAVTIDAVSAIPNAGVLWIVAGNDRVTLRRSATLVLLQPTANPDLAMQTDDRLMFLCRSGTRVIELDRGLTL